MSVLIRSILVWIPEPAFAHPLHETSSMKIGERFSHIVSKVAIATDRRDPLPVRNPEDCLPAHWAADVLEQSQYLGVEIVQVLVRSYLLWFKPRVSTRLTVKSPDCVLPHSLMKLLDFWPKVRPGS